MKKLASAAAFVALCSVAWSSSAQETKFGDKGTLAIHAATGSPMLETTFTNARLGATPTLGVQTSTWDGPERCDARGCERDSYRWTSFYLNPRIHFFVIDNLSIGGEVLFASLSGSRIEKRTDRTTTIDIDESPTALGIMPLIGYNIRITDKFSIWPHGGVGYRNVSWEYPGNDVSENWWFFNADVPFMLNIVPHFSIGAGPGVTATLDQTRKNRTPVATIETDHGFTMWRWFNAHVIGYF